MGMMVKMCDVVWFFGVEVELIWLLLVFLDVEIRHRCVAFVVFFENRI